MVQRHQRFALDDVSYAGLPLGNATVDVWQADGSPVWCARVLVDIRTLPERGAFAGSTRDGRRMTGQCRVGDGALGPASKSKQIVEFLGEGELIG